MALLRDGAALDRVSTDFGGMVRRRPDAVLVPDTAADIAEVIRAARSTYDPDGLLNRGQGIFP